jgi:hypothetical protein
MELKELHKQKSTWAGIAAIVAAVGGYFTGTLDAQGLFTGIASGLVLIFLPEFKRPAA